MRSRATGFLKIIMTYYNNLPVYRSSYNLLLDIYNLTKNFSREYKYTLGQKLKQTGIAGVIMCLVGIIFLLK